jgi:hypothetical protein
MFRYAEPFPSPDDHFTGGMSQCAVRAAQP